jgi:hypothetical protein
VFVGVGIDELLDEIKKAEDYTIALFEGCEGHVIWVTDDEEIGHSVFVTSTNGVNKDKLLEVNNKNRKSLFLWHIDGVMFERYSKCDCALLHDRLMHMVEFKANAKNATDDSIQANYEKAKKQLTLTFNAFRELYAKKGFDLWDVFRDIDAKIVFNKTVPQDIAYQKSLQKQVANDINVSLTFGNTLDVE